MNLSIQNVAVIGAGVSGVVSALHLEATGLKVTVYERSSTSGGIWVYDSRRPPEPGYPAINPSEADFTVDDEFEDTKCQDVEFEMDEDQIAEAESLHAPPGPCYQSLTTNVPSALLQMKNHPWDEGTPEYINHRVAKDYIQAAARKSGMLTSYLYNARVERIWKREEKWQIKSATLTHLTNGNLKRSTGIQEFDAVVVASGHYHACRVPEIVGLGAWKAMWPSRVHHSKEYRIPNGYRNQNVLLIGAGVSAIDIARELASVGTRIYQSCRGGSFDLPTAFLPENAIRVSEISSFDDPTSQNDSHDPNSTAQNQEEAIPATVTLKDGTVLEGIHQVLVCTGYHFSYPFLRELHKDATTVKEADDHVLVTDGTQMHNLHKDIFYIPDPTICFIGVCYYGATFTLFEFQAIAVAAVYAGRAMLPPHDTMRLEYMARLERKGYGRRFHSVLFEEEEDYVRDLIEWVNRDGVTQGLEPIEGHTANWLAVKAARTEELRANFGNFGK